MDWSTGPNQRLRGGTHHRDVRKRPSQTVIRLGVGGSHLSAPDRTFDHRLNVWMTVPMLMRKKTTIVQYTYATGFALGNAGKARFPTSLRELCRTYIKERTIIVDTDTDNKLNQIIPSTLPTSIL